MEHATAMQVYEAETRAVIQTLFVAVVLLGVFCAIAVLEIVRRWFKQRSQRRTVHELTRQLAEKAHKLGLLEEMIDIGNARNKKLLEAARELTTKWKSESDRQKTIRETTELALTATKKALDARDKDIGYLRDLIMAAEAVEDRIAPSPSVAT